MSDNGYGHMVHDYYVAKVREVHQQRSERLKSIKTKRQALLYQQEADRKSTRLNSSHIPLSRMPSSA